MKQYKMQKRKEYLFTLSLILIEWLIFKHFYPYPDFFSDSYAYIDAASNNLNIQIWPIGYSKFLSAIPILTHSSFGLVTLQYALVTLSSTYLYTTLISIFNPGKGSMLFFKLVLFFNPLILYLSNYVSSESIFFALSTVWISILLRIAYNRTSAIAFFLQALVITIAYTFRYNAIYYPLVSIFVILIYSQDSILKKLVYSALAPFLIICFILFSSNAGKKLTGKPIASVLSGWQLANNALYIRGQIQVDTTDLPNKQCIYLDEIAHHFFTKVGPGFKTYLNTYVGNYFIQNWSAPLKTYMILTYGKSTIYSWADASPTFYQYGKAIIIHHPFSYLRYYLMPNAKFYFIPPLEKLEVYNMGDDSTSFIAESWFNYPNKHIVCASNSIQASILCLYPYIFLLTNLLTPILYVIILTKRKTGTQIFIRGLTLISLFWLLNMIFSVIANSAVLRYEFFPFVLLLLTNSLSVDALEVKKQRDNSIVTAPI